MWIEKLNTFSFIKIHVYTTRFVLFCFESSCSIEQFVWFICHQTSRRWFTDPDPLMLPILLQVGLPLRQLFYFYIFPLKLLTHWIRSRKENTGDELFPVIHTQKTAPSSLYCIALSFCHEGVTFWVRSKLYRPMVCEFF